MESSSSAGIKNWFLTWVFFFFVLSLLFPLSLPHPCMGRNILWDFNEFLGRASHNATVLSVHGKWPSLPCKILCHWLTCLQPTWSLWSFPFLPLSHSHFWRVWKEEMKACEDQNKICYITLICILYLSVCFPALPGLWYMCNNVDSQSRNNVKSQKQNK